MNLKIPTKKTKRKKLSKPMVYFKTVFIVSLFAGALLVGLLLKNYYKKNQTGKVNNNPIYNRQYPTPQNKNNNKEVLGKQTKKTSSIPNLLNNASSSVIQSVQDAKSAASDKVQDIFFSTAVKPIIEKINKLPQKEQQEIKKEICK